MKRAILIAIILFSVFFRLWGISSESYWVDEAVSIRQAQVSFADSLHFAKADGQLPLYVTLLNVWGHFFGFSELSTRMISAIFGIASVYLIYLLGKRLFSERIGLYAAALLAFSKLAVFYSQETRLYGMFLFLTLLSFYSFARLIGEKSLKNWIFYSVSVLLIMSTQMFAVFVLFVQSLFYFYKNRKDLRTLINWSILQLPILALFLPYFFLLSRQIKDTGITAWLQAPSFFSLAVTFFAFLTNSVVSALFGLLVLFVLARMVLKRLHLKGEGYSLLLITLWVFVPISMVFLYSVFFMPIYHTRYFLFVLPAFYILFAWLISKVSKQALYQTSVLLVVLIAASVSVISQAKTVEKDDWRKAASFISDHVKVNESVFVSPFFHQQPLFFYYDRECFRASEVFSCNFEKNRIVSLGPRSDCCTYETLVLGEGTLGDYVKSQVWLVSIRSFTREEERKLFGYFNNTKSLSEHYSIGDILIYHFE